MRGVMSDDVSIVLTTTALGSIAILWTWLISNENIRKRYDIRFSLEVNILSLFVNLLIIKARKKPNLSL